MFRRYNVQKEIGLVVYTIFNAKNCVIWNELIAKSMKFVLTMSKDCDKTDCCVVVIRQNFMHFIYDM